MRSEYKIVNWIAITKLDSNEINLLLVNVEMDEIARAADAFNGISL